MKRKCNCIWAFAASFVLLGLSLGSHAQGYFSQPTCEGSRGFAKRVFLTKQQGVSFAKYREIEGNSPAGPAGDLVANIERAIFANSKITSESLASEYAYATCMAWRK